MYWFGDKGDYVKAEKLPELLQTHQKELVAL
jgi:hypothetical protein